MTPDSGQGLKFDSGKPRYDLIPVAALEELGHAYRVGADKYDERNWEKGMRWGRYYRAILAHALAWWCGERYDRDSGAHHLAAVAFSAFALIEYERRGAGQDDRPASYAGIKLPPNGRDPRQLEFNI